MSLLVFESLQNKIFMKIVHVVEPFVGGIVTFINSLVKNLDDDSHIIIHGEREELMPLSEVKKQFSSPNVKFLRWKSAQRSLNPQKDIFAFLELYTILKRLKVSDSIDVVHLHSSKGGFLGRIVCRLLGIQDVVFYTPNGAPFLANESLTTNYIYKKLEKIASSFGGQVVSCSPSEQKAYKLAGIDSVTINNGIQPKKVATLSKSRKKDRIFRIVTSGRIADQKNPILFNKIATYFEEFKQFKFLWIGEGNQRNLLTAKNIQVTGWLAKEELDKVVNDADVYLSTANFEGLPFAVLEALALKKPVLLTDCVGNKDLVMNGLNGDVYKNENQAINKILHFYNNSSMLNIMGEHSIAHCKTSFDLSDTYNSYRDLYQKASLIYKGSNIRLNN